MTSETAVIFRAFFCSSPSPKSTLNLKIISWKSTFKKFRPKEEKGLTVFFRKMEKKLVLVGSSSGFHDALSIHCIYCKCISSFDRWHYVTITKLGF